MIINKIEFTYWAYTEWLKVRTRYNAELIGVYLKDHCKNRSDSAYTTMKELGFEKFTPDCWTQAGEMILNNETIEI